MTALATLETTTKPTESQIKPTGRRLNRAAIIWIGVFHLGVLAAAFTFSWSGLVVCAVLYVLTGLGITLGYHRLLTHRSYQTPRFVEYPIAVLGVLANEGGPLKWVATHRKHHACSDRDGDPHSPRNGFWWSHMLWWMHLDPVLDDPVLGRQNVKDLARDPFYRFLESWQVLPSLVLAGLLYAGGEVWAGVGLSWLVWGMFVRTCLVQHSTWLVNSAAHVWGYRSFEDRDTSTNLWWVALLSFGEGWHNNHHAFQRSARHGLRWWEVDLTYLLIRWLGVFSLAWEIHLAPRPVSPGNGISRWRVLLPRHVPAGPRVLGKG
jgi:fatty-acid desaturase